MLYISYDLNNKQKDNLYKYKLLIKNPPPMNLEKTKVNYRKGFISKNTQFISINDFNIPLVVVF